MINLTNTGSNPKKDSNKYRFQQVGLRIRWVDYQRIRAVFPPQRYESASEYFKRLSLWLQTFKGIGVIE